MLHVKANGIINQLSPIFSSIHRISEPASDDGSVVTSLPGGVIEIWSSKPSSSAEEGDGPHMLRRIVLGPVLGVR